MDKKIWLENGEIYFKSRKASWKCPLKSVKLIGEYTTDSGPGADDYFFVFYTKTHEYTASFYSDNRDRFFLDLSKALNYEFTFKLVNSTSFKSRVLWPARFCDQPLFQIIEDEKRIFSENIKLASSLDEYLNLITD